MKIIFKIVDYLPETNQIAVSFCRQNAPKSIDEYGAKMFDLDGLDTTDGLSLIESLFQAGLPLIASREAEEETLPSNVADEATNEQTIEDLLGKVVEIDTKHLTDQKTRRMKRIKL